MSFCHDALTLFVFSQYYCRGCRNFKPKYISMAEQMNAKYADVEVYAVSCAPFKEICNKHKIKGYPVSDVLPVVGLRLFLLKR
jgi:hypothetical protein